MKKNLPVAGGKEGIGGGNFSRSGRRGAIAQREEQENLLNNSRLETTKQSDGQR
jgi:hypothetical protein